VVVKGWPLRHLFFFFPDYCCSEKNFNSVNARMSLRSILLYNGEQLQTIRPTQTLNGEQPE